jgi:hypothetical protein
MASGDVSNAPERQPVAQRMGASSTDRREGESAPLERYANNPALAGQRAQARERWYGLRTALWTRSTLPRVRKCGRCKRAAKVGVRSTNQSAGYSGLVSCGSIWVCPVCSRKIAAKRAVEVGHVVAAAVSEGLTVVLLTKTLSHHAGQPLAVTWDAVRDCWDSIIKNKWYREAKTAIGLIGTIRNAEVTHGVNGFHPHMHALLIMRGDVTNAELANFIAGIDQRWASKAVSLGLALPLAVGQDYRRITPEEIGEVADYMSKGHKDTPLDPGKLGLELTFTQSKKARSAHATRSMWEVLENAVERGEQADVKTWQEFERVSKGRRSLVWSRGLRERFNLGKELSDEEIAAEEIGTEDDTVLYITNAGWSKMVRYRPDLIPQVLDVVEQGGFDALAIFLEFHGIEFEPA